MSESSAPDGFILDEDKCPARSINSGKTKGEWVQCESDRDPNHPGGVCNKHCRAKKKASRSENNTGYCEAPAGRGTNHVGYGVCKMHLGNSEDYLKGIARQWAEGRALSMLDKLGSPDPIEHPVLELIALASERKAWLNILRDQVMELDTLVSLDLNDSEQAKALVALYTAAQNDIERHLIGLVRLDLESRANKISETQATMIVTALKEVIGDKQFQLDEGTQDSLLAAVGARFHELRNRPAISSA